MVTVVSLDCEQTCVRASVALQVEGIVEALTTKGAQVALHIRVALEMPVK
mgnify:CR=1 FL=1